MTQRREITLLVLGDFVAINAAWAIFFWLRVESGWFVFGHTIHTDVSSSLLPITSLEIYAFWMAMFLIFGLYRPWYVRPPFDEIVTLLKTLGVGTIILSLLIWWDPSDTSSLTANDPRILGLTYFCVTAALSVSFRSLIRLGQRRLLESGVGRRLSIIVGEPEMAQQLADQIARYPRLGYEVIGFVNSCTTAVAGSAAFAIRQRSGKVTTPREIPQLGTIEELESVIESYHPKEVLIALGSNEHDKLIDLISRASHSNVGLKIVPDLYDIVSGQARTREIYGFPLIDINPILLRPWEVAAKRGMDVAVSALILTAGVPVWCLIGVAVKLSSAGPPIYSQERIGKDGKRFRIYKFRSMHLDAERSGPQWASKNDPRVTPLGRLLRKSHLDEVPQFWNVLKGDMSLVGPRPEREFFVKQLLRDVPYYDRRHKVRPGVTGLYQTAVHKYDENIEDVKQKVKYDLMYIESISMRLDIKILFRTAYMMLRGKGQA